MSQDKPQEERGVQDRTALTQLKAALHWAFANQVRSEWTAEQYRPSDAYRQAKVVLRNFRLPRTDLLPNVAGLSYNDVLRTCREVFGREESLISIEGVSIDTVILIVWKYGEETILSLKLAGEITEAEKREVLNDANYYTVIDPLPFYVETAKMRKHSGEQVDLDSVVSDIEIARIKRAEREAIERATITLPSSTSS